MQLLGFDDDDRAFLAVPAAALALVTALLLGIAVGYAVARPGEQGGDASAPSVSGGAPAAPGGCEVAVEQARTALDAAEDVDAALRSSTAALIDLRAERLTSDQALERSQPALTDGARQSVRLDLATQLFLQLATDCRQ